MSFPAKTRDDARHPGARGAAAVVGSGPNGLAAAVHLARGGFQVTVYEAEDTVGGALRSAPVFGEGTIVDLGSAAHPFGIASPFFRGLGLERHGLVWKHPRFPAAHPLDGRPAAVLADSLDRTAFELGVDASAWRRVVGPTVEDWDNQFGAVMGPVVRVPEHPISLVNFGLRAAWPVTLLTKAVFRDEPARALFAGCAAHSFIPLHHPVTSAFGVLFTAAAAVHGWPVAEGGSQAIANALVAELEAHGGCVLTGHRVTDVAELGHPDVTMLDVGPHQAEAMLGGRLPARVRRSLRIWKYGAAAYKVDYLVDGPVPWSDPRVAEAGTVHLGGTVDQIAEAEAEVYKNRIPERPFVLLCQQSTADVTRVPEGKQIVYAYAHVPNGADDPAIGRSIDAQIERFAPGFRDRVLARVDTSPSDLHAQNDNLIGGDIIGGSVVGTQAVLRPRPGLDPYGLGVPGTYLCSASTPPGGGVHGMPGFHAAQRALADHAKKR